MKPTPSRTHAFYAELAKLLEAGFGIREAARVMAEHKLPADQAAVLDRMLRGLEEGKTISDSIGPEISSLDRYVLAAGERGGRLPQAMRHLASHYDLLATTRRELLRGLVPPFLVLHLGVFVATVPTALARGVADPAKIAFSSLGLLAAAYAVILLAGFCGRFLWTAARDQAAPDRLLRRIPLIGRARETLALAGFCKVYHIGLLAGLPVRETVTSAAGASRSGAIRDAEKRLLETIAAGQPMGPALLGEPAFPRDFARSFANGEAAGTLDKDLEHWSRRYDDEARTAARTAATVLPKLFYLLAMLFVAWKIVGFYGAYYGQFDSLE